MFLYLVSDIGSVSLNKAQNPGKKEEIKDLDAFFFEAAKAAGKESPFIPGSDNDPYPNISAEAILSQYMNPALSKGGFIDFFLAWHVESEAAYSKLEQVTGKEITQERINATENYLREIAKGKKVDPDGDNNLTYKDLVKIWNDTGDIVIPPLPEPQNHFEVKIPHRGELNKDRHTKADLKKDLNSKKLVSIVPNDTYLKRAIFGNSNNNNSHMKNNFHGGKYSGLMFDFSNGTLAMPAKNKKKG